MVDHLAHVHCLRSEQCTCAYASKQVIAGWQCTNVKVLDQTIKALSEELRQGQSV